MLLESLLEIDPGELMLKASLSGAEFPRQEQFRNPFSLLPQTEIQAIWMGSSVTSTLPRYANTISHQGCICLCAPCRERTECNNDNYGEVCWSFVLLKQKHPHVRTRMH